MKISRFGGLWKVVRRLSPDSLEWTNALTVVSGLARRDGIRFRHCLPFARVSRMVVRGMSGARKLANSTEVIGK